MGVKVRNMHSAAEQILILDQMLHTTYQDTTGRTQYKQVCTLHCNLQKWIFY